MNNHNKTSTSKDDLNNRYNTDPGAGKMPPQAIDLEEAVIGAMMLEKEAFLTCSEILEPECFYKDCHQVIFESMRNLNSKGSPIDMLTVIEELRTMGKLEEVGGMFTITELTSGVASAAHIEYHATVIKEKYIARVVINKSSELYSLAYSNSASVDDLVSCSSDLDKSIADLINFGTLIVPFRDHVDDAMKHLDDRIHKNDNGIPIGVPTPINDLNRILVGFIPTNLIILAARPSVGKTAVALACAEHQSEQGFIPAFFSMEMASVSLVNRLLLAKSDIDPDSFRTGDISPSERKQLDVAADVLRKRNIYIDDKSAVSSSYIRSKTSKLVKAKKCNIVYIDYLQIADIGDKARHEAIGKTTGELKAMAKELNIPVVVLSQVGRAAAQRAGSEAKRPNMADLKDSGSIEQDADVIIFIHDPKKAGAEEFEDGEPIPEGYLDLIVAKQRDGPTGTVSVIANKSRSSYTDYEKNRRSQEVIEEIDFDAQNGSNSNEQININFDDEVDTRMGHY